MQLRPWIIGERAECVCRLALRPAEPIGRGASRERCVLLEMRGGEREHDLREGERGLFLQFFSAQSRCGVIGDRW